MDFIFCRSRRRRFCVRAIGSLGVEIIGPTFEDLTNPEWFDEHVVQVRSVSLCDTGVGVTYGDSLLTLSTCDYHTGNGRFVVVARKFDQKEGLD